MKKHRFSRVLMKSGIVKKDGCSELYVNDGCSKLYVKDVTEVLQKPVEICARDDFMFHPERENALSRAAYQGVSTLYIWTCNDEVKKDMIESRDSGTECN